jgi:hypothetical protein
VSGDLFFFVRDNGDAGSDYFALVENIAEPSAQADAVYGAGISYQVEYPETRIAFSGHASEAEVVWAVPVIGQTPVFDYNFFDVPDKEGNFSFEVPKAGSVYFKLGMEDGTGPKKKVGTSPKEKKDTIKKEKEVIILPSPEASRYMIHPDRFTAGASGLSLVFAENPGMPDTWKSSAKITPSTGECSWSPAGNASFYHLRMNYLAKVIKINQVQAAPTAVYGLVEGNSVTFPESIDLSDTDPSSIVPVWSEGVIAVPGTDLMVTSFGDAAGTLIYYDYLATDIVNTDAQ